MTWLSLRGFCVIWANLYGVKDCCCHWELHNFVLEKLLNTWFGVPHNFSGLLLSLSVLLSAPSCLNTALMFSPLCAWVELKSLLGRKLIPRKLLNNQLKKKPEMFFHLIYYSLPNG